MPLVVLSTPGSLGYPNCCGCFHKGQIGNILLSWTENEKVYEEADDTATKE